MLADCVNAVSQVVQRKEHLYTDRQRKQTHMQVLSTQKCLM